MRNAFSLAAVLAGLLIVSGSARADLVTNGGFETGDFTGWTVTRAPNGSSGLIVASYDPYAGNYDATFYGGGPQFDQISQTLATTAGTSYTLSYEFDSGGDSLAADGADFQTLINGSVVQDPANGSLAYTLETYTFTATGSSTVLAFQGYDPANDFRLDNVSVMPNTPAVPEPASIVLCGIAGAVGSARAWARRKRAATA